jgi:redox-sensitive bicupin YhaK (pirin superfamily)
MQGLVTRLMSPSDFGEILKPFVFLDLFDHQGAPFNGGLHPHSGIATLSYVIEGAVSFIDPDSVSGTLSAGGVEWMQAGRGMWHGGGLDKEGRTRGFQLWIALPPELELGPAISIYQAREHVPQVGPARVLLGSYGSASSAIVSPSPINYLAVRLKAGERWRYQPPTGHMVLWTGSHQAPYRFPTSCGAATWRLSSHRAKRSSSRRGATLNSFSARPPRTSMTSSSALTRSTRRTPRCAMPKRTYR